MLIKYFPDPENPEMAQFWFSCPGCESYHMVEAPLEQYNQDPDSPTLAMPIGTIYNKNTDPDTPIAETKQCWVTEITDGRIHYHPNTHHQHAGKSAAMVPIAEE